MIVVELIYNLFALVALSVISGFIDARYDRKTVPGQIFQGLLFGAVSIFGMLNPFVLTQGIIFDGRSIVISLASFFFGPLTGIISAIIAAIYRFHIGGGGMIMGEMVIFTSFFVGYLFFRWRKNYSQLKVRKRTIYLMGLIVHTLMVLYMFILPAGRVLETINTVAFTVLAIYPFITLIIGKILLDQELNQLYFREISVSEQLYRSTFYSIGDGVITTDNSGKITRMNQSAQKLTGWDEKDAIGKNFSEIYNTVNELSEARLESPVDFVLKSKSIKELSANTLLITKDGRDIPIGDTAAPLTNEAGEVNGAVIIFRDQGAVRNFQKELKERERQLSTLLSNLPGMVYRCKNDEDWTMVFVSEGSVELTGYLPGEFIGNSKIAYGDIIHPDFRQYVWDEIQEAISNKTPFRLTYKIIPLSGAEKWVWEQGRGIFDDKGELLFLEGFITDITERKSAEERYQFYNERLKLLSTVTTQAIGLLPVEVVAKNMLEEIVRAFRVDAAMIRLLEGDSLRRFVSVNIPDDKAGLYLPAQQGLGSKIINAREPFAIADAAGYARNSWNIADESKVFHFQSYAGAPLFSKEKVIGIIGIYTTAKRREFSSEDLQHLQIAANFIAVAIENTRLFNELNTRKSELENEIKARIRTERQLRESERRSDIIIRNTNVILYRLNYSTRKYDYIHPVVEEITGYTFEEINNLGFSKLVEKIESVSGEDINSKELKEDTSHLEMEFRADYLIRKKNGDYCWLSDHSLPWYDDDGKVIGSVGVLTDITSRKAIEREIEDQRNKFKQLFENSPLAIILINDSNSVTAVNRSFTELFGYTIDEIRERDIDEILVPPELREDARALSAECQKGFPVSSETYRLKKNGEKIFVRAAGVPVISEGKTTFIYGMYVDLTERKRSEEEIRIARDKAEEMSRLKSNFLANMSHELRTPLIGIQGFSEILKEDSTEESVRSMAETINRSGARLLETLNLILDLSRVEAGRLEVKTERVNIIAVIDEVLRLFSERAAQKGLYIRAEYGDNIPEIESDGKIIVQILNNLVNNAVKFTQQGGITVTAGRDNDNIVISVADTGIGISAKDQKIIWEEFRQASEGLSRGFEGTGLGLTLTKRFVEKLGGTINLTSELGKGSVFTVSLPVSLQQQSPASLPAEKTDETIAVSPVLKDSELKKVLLVEDDPVAVDLMTAMLGRRFRLDVVNRGEDGIEKAGADAYDLFLMDINLGKGMNGMDVTKKIRELPQYKDTPIIAVTAFAMVGDREEFLAAGCSHYISKPFTRRQLMEVIEEALKNL